MISKFAIFRNNKGNSVIEFALVLPILLLVVFGITEFGRAIMVTNVLNSASREGARLAAVSSFADSTAVRNRVIEVLTAANITPKDIAIEYSSSTRTIKVTVTNAFEVLSAGVLGSFAGTIELRGTTVMKYEG
jgi:Flp pilus assembly protein TadG